MTDIAHSLVAFSDFTFDLEKFFLRRDGAPVPLKRQSAEVLALLLKSHGEVVSREEIRDHIWKDRLIEFDQGINACVRDIRHALGDDPKAPQFIETRPRVGYRFVREVTPVRGRKTPKRLAFGLGLALVAVGLVALGIGAFGPLNAPRPHGSEQERIAVMPFTMLDDDSADPQQAERLTELMVLNLAESQSRVRVISADDLFGDSRPAPGMGDVSRWLEADYILAGGIHHVDGVLTLSLRLVRSEGYVHLWARSFSIENDVPPFSTVVGEIEAAIEGE
jgi:DNA-binding winged helix-turn-helix (wHTH) protein/TolB-like protein